MMTQLGHAQTAEGARSNKHARTAMWITVLSVVLAFALFCVASEALAETYTPHARRITPRYSTAHFVTHRTRARGRGAKAEPVSEHASSRKASARGRRMEREAQAAPASMHRVTSGHRRSGRGQGSERLDVVAETKAHAGESSVEAALPARDLASAAGARVSAGGAYASGVAHPAESVTAPSDLVGAPLTATAESETRPPANVGGASLAAREDLADEATQPVVLPGLYRYGRLVVPPPMRGTREILVHQNLIADEEGLSRIQDDDDLRRMRTERMLLDFPESASLHVNDELAGDRRCARPWTVRFAADIARAYYARFHQPLQLNSAVRTVAYQVRLRRVNGNAAGVGGEMASPHLTGEAIDFGKRDMNTEEIAWMRTYLRPLMQVGKVDVEEEFQQACFHISVYRSYAPEMPASRREVAQLHGAHVTRVSTDADQ